MAFEGGSRTMATDPPTRALLHKLVTTTQGLCGSFYSVAYVEDPDGGRHLVFASSDRFGDLDLLPLMKGHKIALAPGSACLEVLPLHCQSKEVQWLVAERCSVAARRHPWGCPGGGRSSIAAEGEHRAMGFEGGSRTMATDPPMRALLHKLVTTAQGPFGSFYTVAYVTDPDGDRHLVFASSDRFGNLDLLPLMKGHEIALASGSPCPEVLPVYCQSEQVQQLIAARCSLLPGMGSMLPGCWAGLDAA